MQFKFKMISSLPKLAWCAHIQKESDIIEVFHGPWVETTQNFFFEGAWAGNYSSGRFASSCSCIGSGAALENSTIEFATPSFPKEKLCLIRLDKKIVISNSIAFCLSEANDKPDLNYPFYTFDFMSYTKGLNKLVNRVPTQRGRFIELYYCCNFTIDSKLTIKKYPKKQPDQFCNYTHYLTYIKNEINEIYQNANHQLRTQTYKPLSTISSGYDSPACTVLAQDVGCIEALTFKSSRAQFNQASDSGIEIANILRVKVKECERLDFMNRNDFPEAEFLAVGTGGEDVVMSSFEDNIAGTLFFTGFGGGTVWARFHSDLKGASNYVTKDFSGSTLLEFRLRLGFINLPIPLLTLSRYPSLYRISNSDEMKPWQLNGTTYDRPIARRIVEDKGVPRSLIGMSKQAATQPFYHNIPLKDTMAKDSYCDFNKFIENIELNINLGQRVAFVIGPYFYSVRYFTARIVAKMLKIVGIYLALPFFFAERYYKPFSKNILAFHWGILKVSPRYFYSEKDQLE